MTSTYQSVGPDDEPRLRDEHAYLERVLEELRQSIGASAPQESKAAWECFVRDLEQHLHYEEGLLFPAYEKRNADAGVQLERMRKDHAILRGHVRALSGAVAGGLPTEAQLGAFSAALDAHHQAEAQVLYPWLASLPDGL